MSPRKNLFEILFLAFILFLLPAFGIASPPQVTDILPANAIPGQYIRIIGGGFPQSIGFTSTTRVSFQQGSVNESTYPTSTATEVWVPLPPSLVPGPVTIKVSNGANTSQPFIYTVGSERAAPVARSFFPAVPYPGQRVFVAVDGFTRSSTTDVLEIRQGEELFYAEIETAGTELEGERIVNPRESAPGLHAGESATDELISTIAPSTSRGGGVITLPPELVAGPATIRAGYQVSSDTVLWGPALAFTVGSTPTSITLLEVSSSPVAVGQNLFLLTDSPLPSGVVGDPAPGTLVLEFSQGSLSQEKAPGRGGQYLYTSLPEGFSPGAASVRVKTSFSGSGVVLTSNSLDFVIATTPLRPTLTSWGPIASGGGVVSTTVNQLLTQVPFPAQPSANLVRIRQGGTVYEVTASSATAGQLNFPRPPALTAGIAEVSVVSTYGGTAAEETNRLAVEVCGGPSVLISLSSSTALGGQRLWAFGSGFGRTSSMVRFYQGDTWVSSTWAPVNEPEALSFQVPASLGPGVYQVAIWHGGGESARLSLDVGSVAAPVQVLSCPANLEAGERFVTRPKRTRSDTSNTNVKDETPNGKASAHWQ
ncbi:MAG: hypothetical protein EHM18_15280, partial [Acidobacteria bacterium]